MLAGLSHQVGLSSFTFCPSLLIWIRPLLDCLDIGITQGMFVYLIHLITAKEKSDGGKQLSTLYIYLSCSLIAPKVSHPFPEHGIDHLGVWKQPKLHKTDCLSDGSTSLDVEADHETTLWPGLLH